MKRQTKHHLLRTSIIMLAGLTLLVLMASCTPQSNTADLHICLERYQGASRTINPNDPLQVVDYHVTGAGPDGTSFTTTTDNTQFTVNGLLTGNWTVTVIGFSSNGVGLIQGSSVITLSNTNSSGVVTLDEFFGTGSAEIAVTWDHSQTISPEVISHLKRCGSQEAPELLTAASTADGQVTYAIEDKEAGAYLFTSELQSNGLKIAGTARIIRIIDSTTTVGTVAMTFNDLQITLGSNIIDDSTPPISGEITGIPITVTAGQAIDVTFVPSAESLQTGFSCEWFLDGVYLNTGNPVSVTPPAGKHRLDVIVTADNLGSTGSATQDIFGVGTLATGTPLLYEQYVHGEQEEFLLDGLSDIAVLPDGLILTASKISDSLQTMRISADKLLKKESFIHDNTSILLDGASMIAHSDDSQYIAVASDNSKTITIFTHVPNTDTISWAQTILPNGSEGTYTFSTINSIAMTNDGAYLYVADKTSNVITLFTRTGDTFGFTSNHSYAPTPGIDNIKSMATGFLIGSPAKDNLLSLASANTNSLHLLGIGATGVPTLHYSLDFAEAGLSGLSELRQVYHPQDDTLFTLSKDSICVFKLFEDSFCIGYSQESRLKSQSQIPVSFSPQDICASSDNGKLYVVTSTGKGIVIFDHDPATYNLTYSSFQTTDAMVPDSCAISTDDDYLIVGSSGSDTLQLYKFSL